MKMLNRMLTWKRFFDGSDDDDAAAAAAAEAEAAAAAAAAATKDKDKGKGKDKTFTQADVDKIVETRLSRQKSQQEKAIARMEELEKTANMTQEERDALKVEIEEMRTAISTKEELAAKERKTLEQKHQETVKTLAQENEKWKNMFTTSTIQRAIMDAASQSEAVRPQLLVDVLGGKTRLVEEKDGEGKATGNLVPYAKFESLDKDGKQIVLDLPVGEAVKQMKDTPQMYGSLFKSGATGGVGGNNMHTGTVPAGTIPTSYEDYYQRRKEFVGAK